MTECSSGFLTLAMDIALHPELTRRTMRLRPCLNPIEKGFSHKHGEKPFDFGRDDWIRTSGLTHPKGARYQAAPRPVKTFSVWPERMFCQTSVVSAAPASTLLGKRRLNLSVAISEQIKNLAQLLSDLAQGRALFAGLLRRLSACSRHAEPRC